MTQGGRTSGSLDDEGAIGIGTMIVFIAMVIVAAVAAAVLINTAGTLQRKSGETGQETTQEVSGNIFVRDIIGNVSDSSGDIQNVSWYVSLAPGAEPIDLENLVIRWEHDDDLADLTHNDPPNCTDLASGFCVETILDVGDEDPNVLSEGDRAKIYANLSSTEEISTRASVDVLFVPEKGTPIDAGFKTPATFGQKSNISLK